MWLEGGVGASEATDLADWKPGAAEQAAERIPFVETVGNIQIAHNNCFYLQNPVIIL
jgi:hypothetical protein